MRRLLPLALLLLWPLAAVAGDRPSGSLESQARPQEAWYVTGPSNFAAAADIPWPPDNGEHGDGLGQTEPSVPGSVVGGWWSTIRYYLRGRNLIMGKRNNSTGGYTVCNYLHPFCCYDGSIFRIDSCPSADATGDTYCNGINAGETCEQSNAYYLEGDATTPWEGASTGSKNYEGINRIPTTIVTFAPGPNECTRPNTTAEQIVDATRDLIDGFFANAPKLNRVNLHMGISWHERLPVNNGSHACANLWDYSCAASAGYGGTSCTHTFDKLAAEYGGRVVIQDGAFKQTLGDTMSGETSLYEMYTADELHENIFGWQLVTLPDMLASIGYAVTDHAPASPVPTISGSPTADAVTVDLAGAITDPDGDTLTCILWAVKDSDWAGSYQAADRVHNGFGACRAMNGGTACTNCGDASEDTDCNTTGKFITDYGTDGSAAVNWLTPTDAPEVPDDTDTGTHTMPDFFAIPCDDSATRVVHGLAANTTYRLYAIAWPTLVAGRVDRGVLPSPIHDLVTFTTAP